MDITCLPEELIEEITKYLSLLDVVSCTGVNRRWRDIFSINRIWKRYYTFPPNYFEKQVTKRRNYSFGSSSSKQHVFQELQVKKNLIQGKYTLTRLNRHRLYCENLLDVVDDDGNHLLIIAYTLYNSNLLGKKYKIEVWNMNNDEPVYLVSIETLRVAEMSNSQMKVLKNKFYFIVDNVCMVFEFGRPDHVLKFIFQVTCPENWESMNNTVMVCKPNMVLAFNYSMIHVQLSAEPWVHVWGEDSSLLYKNYSTDEVVQMPNFPPVMLEAQDGGTSDNVALVCNTYSEVLPTMSVLLFNVKTFKYTTLFVKTKAESQYCELNNEMVVAFYHEYHVGQIVPKLICCSTRGDFIYEPDMRRHCIDLQCKILTANEGKEVFILDAKGGVTVFDVFKKKEISKFKICDSTGSNNIGTFIKNKFIIIEEQRKQKKILALGF